MSRLAIFKEQGYYIEKSLVPISAHKELFISFYDLAVSLIQRNKKIQLNYKIKKIEDLIYPNDIEHLDKLLLAILKFDHKLIGEIYDSIAYCSTFLRLIGNVKIEEISKELLEIKSHNTIYSVAPRILMQAPRDERKTYGWHQEIFYNTPKAKFINCFCPIIKDTTIENGALELCKKSHKDGLLKQSWNEPKNRNTQILVDEEVVNRFEQIKIPMEVGDFLFFDKHLVHRSGYNSTKNEIRFSLVNMWNDCSHSDYSAPIPNFKYRKGFEELDKIKNFDILVPIK